MTGYISVGVYSMFACVLEIMGLVLEVDQHAFLEQLGNLRVPIWECLVDSV